MDQSTKDYAAPPKLRSGRASRENEDWDDQMQAEEEVRALFEPGVTLPRSPIKKRNPPPEPPPAPRKPPTKPMARVNEEPSSPTRTIARPTAHENGEHTKNPEKASNPIKTLIQTAIGMMKRTKTRLRSQNTSGASREVRDVVLQEVDEIVAFMEAIHEIEDQMANVKHELQDIKQTMKNSEKPTKRAWDAIPAAVKTPATFPNTVHIGKREIDEKSQQEQTRRRLERAKFEITLIAEGVKTTQNQIAINNHLEITERLQGAVRQATITGPVPTILGVQKLKSSDIRFRCETEEEAERLREVDWSKAYPGIEVRRPKYGVVIHGIPIEEIDPHQDNMEDHARDMEIQNEKLNLKIARLRTLKPPNKLAPHARYTSFVIQTHEPEAADKCLKSGIHYNCRLYPAEKHTPQLQLTQCFNCQKWGHRASHCRGKETCAKCGDKHASKDCTKEGNLEAKCANCGDNHPAWHRDCPHRMREIKRIDEMKYEIKTAYFNE